MKQAARNATIADARQATMAAVSAAVIKMHEAERAKRPEWFWHLLKRCEVKAERIATAAASGPHANGDATFCEVYAKSLPTLFTQALERLDNFVAELSSR
jgi:mannose-6-phosphate isomerase class I